MYNVFLANKLEKNLIFRGTKEEAHEVCENLRRECAKTDPQGIVSGAFVLSDEEIEKSRTAAQIWDTLTDEEKADKITVDGRTYIRKIYELNHT